MIRPEQIASPYHTPQKHVADVQRLLTVHLQRLLDESPRSLMVARPTLSVDAADAAATLTASIAARLQQSPDLPIQRLTRLYGLSSLAAEMLMFLLATELDGNLLQACACLHDDPARRWLSPGLIWRLLALHPADLAARQPFDPNGPLLRQRLIQAPTHINSYPLPLLERPLKLDDRIVAYLLDQHELDAALTDFVALIPAQTSTPEPMFPHSVQQPLVNLLSVWRKSPAPPVFLWGRSGAGKQAGARYLAAALCRPLLTVAAVDLTADRWLSLRREADLRGALIHLTGFDQLDDPVSCWKRLGDGVIVSATKLPAALLTPPPFVVHFPIPDRQVRHTWWQHALNGQGETLNLNDLASQFRLTTGQIQNAIQMAQQQAWLENGPLAQPTKETLFAGARGQSNPALSCLAVRIQPVYTWDDLVLPPAQQNQLRAIVAQTRLAGQVYDDWDFKRKLPYGRGLAALFTGPSGTGKTMSATILARALGLDLYKIDLAGVVSKYIGETEKNLDRIFDEARTANVILFFDEADALFGKRSEVKDAHDRYANIEISYLLQKMEEYDGISILATNFSQNMDEAFTRRMQFVIEFPLPDPEDRERIWRNFFPSSAPVASDINYAFLAEQFELSGGNIKNCVVAAAFMAAEDQQSIGMAYLVRAIATEFSKLNRPLQRTAFGQYFGLVRQDE